MTDLELAAADIQIVCTGMESFAEAVDRSLMAMGECHAAYVDLFRRWKKARDRARRKRRVRQSHGRKR